MSMQQQSETTPDSMVWNKVEDLWRSNDYHGYVGEVFVVRRRHNQNEYAWRCICGTFVFHEVINPICFVYCEEIAMKACSGFLARKIGRASV